MVRLKDIAKKAGVSTPLVSRILSNDKSLSVSEETRKHVIKIAKEMGYKKSNNTSRKIAIFHWYEIEQEINDPYYFFIRNAIIKNLKKNNVDYVVYFSDDKSDYLKDITGIIAIGKFSTKKIREMSSYTKNIIFVDSTPAPNKYSSICVDFNRAMKEVATYFAEKKFQKLGFIGGVEFLNDGSRYDDLRLELFKQHTSYYTSDLVIKYGTFTMESGYNCMKEIIKERNIPEALFCCNDHIAIGAIRAIVEHGYKIPEDIEIIGFDDVPISNYICPSISTIKISTNTMANMAVKMVIEGIDDFQNLVQVVVPIELVHRESTNNGMSL